MKNITILGSSGSVGRSCLEVIKQYPEFKVLLSEEKIPPKELDVLEELFGGIGLRLYEYFNPSELEESEVSETSEATPTAPPAGKDVRRNKATGEAEMWINGGWVPATKQNNNWIPAQ